MGIYLKEKYEMYGGARAKKMKRIWGGGGQSITQMVVKTTSKQLQPQLPSFWWL